MNELVNLWGIRIHVVDASCGARLLRREDQKNLGNIANMMWNKVREDDLTVVLSGNPGHWTTMAMNHRAKTIRHFDQYRASGVGDRADALV